MDILKKKIELSSSKYPYTAVMRDYLHSNDALGMQIGYFKKTAILYDIGLRVWNKRTGKQVFSVNCSGPKLITMEEVYKNCFLSFYGEKNLVQMDTENETNTSIGTAGDKHDNVIVTSDIDPITNNAADPITSLEEWCSTEKIYDFSSGKGSVMNRWFLLDQVTINSNTTSLIKEWKIIEDLLKNHKDSINLLPIKGFTLGKYKLEFRIVMQATPFQAGLVMLSFFPMNYGVVDNYQIPIKINKDPPKNDVVEPLYVFDTSVQLDWKTVPDFGYNQAYCAAMRRNVKIDINPGGEATLEVPFKYHKTFIRNFDYSFDKAVNPGIRGSYFGKLQLHLLSSLTSGAGQNNSINARLMFRIVESKLAAMTSADVDFKQVNVPRHKMLVLKDQRIDSNLKKKIKSFRTLENDFYRRDNTYDSQREQLYKEIVQGGVLGVLGPTFLGTTMAEGIIDNVSKIAERVGLIRGRQIRNRDKPVDTIAVVKTIPRPRQNFNNSCGLDDAIRMCYSPKEITSFHEVFTDEPQTIKDLVSIPSYFGQFKWTVGDAPPKELLTWKIAPNTVPGSGNFINNHLKSLVGIFSSMYLNYWGTLEIQFQLIKTTFHRGALEVAITFSRQVKDENLKSTYVKVCNLHESSGFTVTVPYIYDTPCRFLGNNAFNPGIPNMAPPSTYKFCVNASVTVRVLNELVAPTTVEQSVMCIMWIKGGKDFALNYPIQCNNVVSPKLSLKNPLPTIPVQLRGAMETDSQHISRVWKKDGLHESQTFNSFRDIVQGDLETDGEYGEDIDFSTGEFCDNRITSCSHMDIKNLLKIPVKILSRYEYIEKFVVEGKNRSIKQQSILNIPVTPLTSQLVGFLAERDDRYYWYNSIQYNLLSSFALYRGSLVYTFVFSEYSTVPIYISYIPHDFTVKKMLTPMSEFIAVKNDTDEYLMSVSHRRMADPSTLGFQTVIVIPQVNSSERLEIPMSTQNNWLLLNRAPNNFDANNTDLKTMRESAEAFNGRLCIWSDAPFKLDLFLNCGDDFELGAFIGHPGVMNAYTSTTWTDDFREVIQGFPHKEIVEKLNPFVENVKKIFLSPTVTSVDVLILIATECIQYYSGAIPMGGLAKYVYLAMRTTQVMNPWIKLSTRVKEFVEGPIPQAITKIENGLEEINERGVSTLYEYIKGVFPIVERVPHIQAVIWNIVKEIVHSVISRTWETAAFSFFNILVELKLVTFDSWSLLSESAVKLFKFGNSEMTQGSCEWFDIVSDFSEIFLTILSTTFRCKYWGGLKWFMFDTLLGDTKFYSNLNGTLNLVKRLFMAVKRVVESFIRRKDKNIDQLQQFADKDEEIKEFIESSMLFLNTFNRSDFKKKSKRLMAIALFLQAHKLRGFLLTVKDCNKSMIPLLKLCEDVIKKGNEYQALFRNELVKKEPMVICIDGESEVGKSFAITDFVPKLLQSIGIKPNNIDYIYTISPGVDYWNGYDNQECILYDDWCNLTDEQTIRSHISQLYALKTSAPFNVPRAEIDNKEQIADPSFIITSTNNPFPSHPSFTNKEAIYRRRDIRVRFALKQSYSNIREVPSDELEKFEHLECYWYENTIDPDAKFTKMSYGDFVEKLVKVSQEYHNRELKNMELKYRKLDSIVKGGTIDKLSFRNPFEVIEAANYEVMGDKMTSELLEIEVVKVVNLIKENLAVQDENVILTGTGERVQMGSILFSIAAWMKDKFEEFVRCFDNMFHRCTICSELCQYNNVCLHCPEDHFVCVSCAINAHPSKTSVLSCPLHNKQCEWYFPPLMKVLIVKILQSSLAVPIFIVNLLKILKSQTSIPMKSFLAMFSSITFVLTRMATRFAQGEDDYDLEIDDEPFNLTYDRFTSFVQHEIPKDETVVEAKETVRFVSLEQFNSLVKKNYKCCHWILQDYDYTFIERYFLVNISDRLVHVRPMCCDLEECYLKDFDVSYRLCENIWKEAMACARTAYKEGNLRMARRFLPPLMLPEFELDYTVYDIPEICKKDWWNTYVSPLGEWFTKIIKTTLPWLAVAAGIFTFWKVTKMCINLVMRLLGFNEISESGFVESSGLGRTKHRMNNRNFRIRTQDDNLENKLNVICKNYVVLHCNKRKLVGLGVSGSKILLPKHLLVGLEGYFTVEFLSNKHETTEFHKGNCDVFEIIDRDLAILDLKTKVFFRDIRKFFKARSDFRCPSTGTILQVNCKNVKEINVEDVDVRIKGFVETNEAESVVDNRVYVTKNAIRYDYQKMGLCGCLLVDNSITPILGVHISGMVSICEGSAAQVFREDFDNIKEIVQFDDSGDMHTDYGDDCNITYIGTTPKELTPFVPSKTKIIKSDIDKYFDTPSEVEPAILSNKDPRWAHEKSPMFYGVVKHGKPCKDFHPLLVLQAFSLVSSIILKGKEKKIIRKPSVLSFKEATVGGFAEVQDAYNFGEEMYYECIDEKTSSGWPYSCLARDPLYNVEGTSKRDWLNYIRNEQGKVIDCNLHPYLLNQLKDKHELRKKGILTDNVFQDCLKDEKRKISKLMKQGGTRVFSMSNIEGTIALRRYTLDLTSFIRYNRLDNWIAVGINPESYEWTLLAQRLLGNSKHIFTTDFTNFGPGLNSYLVEKFSDLIIDYYENNNVVLSDEEKNEIRILIQELSCSVHCANNLLYRTKSGSPSGAAITVEINSFVHLMLIIIAWNYIGVTCRQINTGIKSEVTLKTVKDLEMYLKNNFSKEQLKKFGSEMNCETFKDNCYGVVYGDDGIFSIREEYKDLFNAYTVNLVLKEFGIGVTDASKSEKIIPYSTLENTVFLKRNFRKHDLFPNSMYLAKMDWTTVEECSRWIHNNLDQKMATRENCYSSLLLAFGWGKEKYEMHRKRLNNYLLKEGIEEIMLRWEDVHFMFFPDIFIETEIVQMDIEPYSVLEINEEEFDIMNEEDKDKYVKKVYFKKCLKAHPDKGGNESDFIIINMAYRMLMNEENRQKFKQGIYSQEEFVFENVYDLVGDLENDVIKCFSKQFRLFSGLEINN